MDESHLENESPDKSISKLSYKYQRLRERLRHAIVSGELTGKLPGERQLARRFRANAKTLSKALTDLAAEGLLERSIGRGTFVKGQQSVAPVVSEKWLLICDADQVQSPVVQAVAKANPAAQIATDVTPMRPSFINQFKAVIDFADHTPDGFLRDLIVRNITLIAVGHEPHRYSSHAVLADRSLGASVLARDMMLAGHTRFFAVEPAGHTALADAIRHTAPRFVPQSTVEAGGVKGVALALEHGVTAIICGTGLLAQQVREQLQRAGVDVPGQVSLAAVGFSGGDVSCSGYFVPAIQQAEAVLHLLKEKGIHRPVTIWLTGGYREGGTMAPCNIDLSMAHLGLAPDGSRTTA